MVETAMDEKVLKPTVRLPVLHDYGEPFEVQVTVYSLEEIVAEKLRAILQHLRSLERRGWVRSRARDYYDLWQILGTCRDRLDVSDFPVFLREKCKLKDVTFSGPESFFPEAMLATVEKTWKNWLGPLVPNLPPCKTVIEELRQHVAALLAAGK
jgi:predicted nucleotidyltransferase component of viral defense system